MLNLLFSIITSFARASGGLALLPLTLVLAPCVQFLCKA